MHVDPRIVSNKVVHGYRDIVQKNDGRVEVFLGLAWVSLFRFGNDPAFSVNAQFGGAFVLFFGTSCAFLI
jgi:hypothetical protein